MAETDIKKNQLRKYLEDRGAVLATIDNIFEESRVLILIDGNKEDNELILPRYDLLFGYNIYQARQFTEMNGHFNFQAHFYVSCLIDLKTKIPRVINTDIGLLSGGNVGSVYLLSDYVEKMSQKPYFPPNSPLIPLTLKITES